MFNEQWWLLECERISVVAARGAGCSYDLYLERFSAAVDGSLGCVAGNEKSLALEIARRYGYLNTAELEENRQSMADSGVCTHGIDVAACPAGCGDRG